jgi:hypothetical protein
MPRLRDSEDGFPRFGSRLRKVVSNDRADLEQILSRAFGRDIGLVEAQAEGMTSGIAEEYWPDIAWLEHRDTVTDFEMPAGTFSTLPSYTC